MQPKPRYKPTCPQCEFICQYGKWDIVKCGGILLAKSDSNPGEYGEHGGHAKKDPELKKAFAFAKAYGPDPSVSPNASKKVGS